MSKKLLILAAFLLLGGVGFYLWQQVEKGGVPSLSSVLPGVKGGTQPKGDLPSYSLVPSLPESVMAVFAMEPRRFDPLGVHFTKVRERFASTAVWKKAGLDQLIEQAMNSSLDEVAQGALANAGDVAALAAAGMPPISPAQLTALLSQEWSRIDEVLFASDGEMFAPMPGVEIPRSLLAVTFKDEESRERVQQLFLVQVLGGQDEMEMDPVTFRRKGDSRVEISSSFLDAMAAFSGEGSDGSTPPPAPPLGAIEFEGKRAFVSIGSASYKAFLPASQGGTSTAPVLSSSARWSSIQSSLVPESAVFVYYDMQKFFAFIESMANTAAGMSGEAAPPLNFLATKDFEWSAASLHVSDGVGARQCARIRADSAAATAYQKVLEGVSENDAGKLLKLVDQNTMAAMNVSRWILDLYSASARVLRLSQEKEAGDAAAASPEWDKYQRTVEALGKLYSRRDFKQVGFIIGGPRPEQVALLMGGPDAPAFVPDVGVLLEFGTAITTQDVAKLFNDTSLLLLGDSDSLPFPLASVVKGSALADGSLPFPEVVKVTLGDDLELRGAAVEQNLFIIAKDEVLLDSLKRRLQSTTPFITQASLASRSMDEQLGNSGMFALISTSSLIELARGFIPMGLMMAPPEMQVGMPDVEEVLNLLNLKLLLVSNGMISSDGLYCSESRAVSL